VKTPTIEVRTRQIMTEHASKVSRETIGILKQPHEQIDNILREKERQKRGDC